MTEAEWLAGDAPWRMPDAVAEQAAKRKVRLAGCAICRRLWDLLTDARSRNAVETAERYVDERATGTELGAAQRRAKAAAVRAGEHDGEAIYHAAEAAQMLASRDRRRGAGPLAGLDWALGAAAHAKRSGMAKVLQCVFGNPFRPVSAELRWLSATTAALAQAIYADRAFDRLPILADALEDAGCDNREILDHCRQPGEHVRGCWVVDLVLGKQ